MFFICKGKRLANYLIEHGSPVIRIDTDQQNKGFLIFIFERNQLLEEGIILEDTREGVKWKRA